MPRSLTPTAIADECPVCATKFRRNYWRGGRRVVYCSPACFQLARWGPPPPCVVCGGPIRTARKYRITCTAQCTRIGVSAARAIRDAFRIAKKSYVRVHRPYVSRTMFRARLLVGKVCRRCGFSDPRALQFDHVNGQGATLPLRSQAVLERGLADGRLQILCANCNWIKRDECGEHVARNPLTTPAARA